MTSTEASTKPSQTSTESGCAIRWRVNDALLSALGQLLHIEVAAVLARRQGAQRGETAGPDGHGAGRWSGYRGFVCAFPSSLSLALRHCFDDRVEEVAERVADKP